MAPLWDFSPLSVVPWSRREMSCLKGLAPAHSRAKVLAEITSGSLSLLGFLLHSLGLIICEDTALPASKSSASAIAYCSWQEKPKSHTMT